MSVPHTIDGMCINLTICKYKINSWLQNFGCANSFHMHNYNSLTYIFTFYPYDLMCNPFCKKLVINSTSGDTIIPSGYGILVAGYNLAGYSVNGVL